MALQPAQRGTAKGRKDRKKTYRPAVPFVEYSLEKKMLCFRRYRSAGWQDLTWEFWVVSLLWSVGRQDVSLLIFRLGPEGEGVAGLGRAMELVGGGLRSSMDSVGCGRSACAASLDHPSAHYLIIALKCVRARQFTRIHSCACTPHCTGT